MLPTRPCNYFSFIRSPWLTPAQNSSMHINPLFCWADYSYQLQFLFVRNCAHIYFVRRANIWTYFFPCKEDAINLERFDVKVDLFRDGQCICQKPTPGCLSFSPVAQNDGKQHIFRITFALFLSPSNTPPSNSAMYQFHLFPLLVPVVCSRILRFQAWTTPVIPCALLVRSPHWWLVFTVELAQPTPTWKRDQGLSRLSWPVSMSRGGCLDCELIVVIVNWGGKN